MILEIHGAGFKNKGAEMMLRTVTSELRERLPGFVPAIDPSYGRYGQRADLGLQQMLPRRTHVGSRRFSWHFRHQKLMSGLPANALFRVLGGGKPTDYGCVTLSDVQGFIDIAGFAYTSHWGSKPTQDLAQLTKYYKKHKKPIILFPQAFGPFESDDIRSAFREVINNASLIFARDSESYNYLQELSPEADTISQAPDITLFYPRKPVNESHTRSGTVGIVPNARILDQGKELWGSSYYNILIAIISYLLQQGVPVEILIHDASGQDREIAEEIRNRAGSPQLPIIDASDPLLVKQRISNYTFIIGSRYHSLVAALSSTVPVIALGWAHKYVLLMDEFDLSDFLFLPDTSVEMALDRVQQLLQEGVNEAYRKQISHYLEKMSALNQEMWGRIIEVLSAS